MRIAPTFLAIVAVMSLAVYAQVLPAPQAPSPQAPATIGAPQQPTPPVVAPTVPPGVPAPVVPPTPLGTRTFTAKTGMIFQSVRAERVMDFETVIGYLQDALRKSTDPAVRAQAEGWKILKATEPGPNATVLYVLLMDPAVPGADYGFGRILSEAYPDRIQEIWKLYTGSLGPGATLLNLTPVEGPLPGPLLTTPAAEPTTTPGARPGPPPAGRGTAPPVAPAPGPGRGTTPRQ